MHKATEQEKFWAGTFGEAYIERNRGSEILASNIALFSQILNRSCGIKSVLEFGANIGLNLRAISSLLPSVTLMGVELNKKATSELSDFVHYAYCASILGEKVWEKADFVLSKGLLIHIAPSNLSKAYGSLYDASNKYICIVEYYNPTPVEIVYRNHRNQLWKRDFAGEMLDYYSLKLLDYGFVYHKDSNFRQDDVHWWLMEK